MSRNWKCELEGLLRDEMRYCFPGGGHEGDFVVELDEVEFSGEPDGSMGGFLDHVIDLVQLLRKEAFMSGYASGVIDAIADVSREVGSEHGAKTVGLVFDEVTNKITAERRFMEIDK
jgi:hypothetical protein